MLLKLNSRLTEARDEHGSALVAVIGVLAVTLIVTAVIASSVVSALGFTTATRAGVQSQAAAEAGIAIAQASLLRGECPTGGVFESTADPAYSVTVSYVSGGVETVGCPVAGATQIFIRADGVAAHPGIYSGGDESQVEAAYIASASGVTASGAAIYAYSAAGFAGSGRLVSVDGSEATVHITTDTLNCAGASRIDASLVVAHGNVQLGGSCTINGNVWAGGNVTIDGNPVVTGGTVVASGNVNVVGNQPVNIWAGGTMNKGWGTVTGNLVAGSSAIIAGTLNGNLWSTSTVTRTSWPTVNGNIVGTDLLGSGPPLNGTFYQLGGGTTPPPTPATPPIPSVPDWIDFTYNPDDWPGYAVATLSGNCTFADLQTAVAGFAMQPGILDTRNCNNGFVLNGNNKLKIYNDLAVISKKFDLSYNGGSGGIRADNPQSVWFITPDSNLTDDVPTPPSGCSFGAGGGFELQSTIKTFTYTPCRVRIGSGVQWYGQIFAGETAIDGNAEMNFIAVGLPGYDVATGMPSGSVGSIESLLAQPPAWVRNVSGG